MSPDDPDSVHLLIMDDDEEMRRLLERVFVDNPDYASQVTTVATLADARDALRAQHFDAVLADLGLPDSDGLRTARAVLDIVDERTAVIVLTGQRDTDLAAHALEIGVQDYVVKDELSPQLCTRVVRYGITRARLLADLEDARAGERRERELRRLERLAVQNSTTGVSAMMLGAGTVRESSPRQFAELEAEYARILQDALEEQVYRTEQQVYRDLRSLASMLGFVGAGPRDVIELHSGVLRQLVSALDPVRATAAVEEARVTVLQLMGHLVSHYRERSMGSTGPRRDTDTPANVKKDAT